MGERIDEQVESLLAAPTFRMEPAEHHSRLLAILRSELSYAAERSPTLRQYLTAWPVDYRCAESIADLPYLPAGTFKSSPPLLLVKPENIVRTLTSSATTGQTPSRIVLDAETSRRIVKGLTRIIADFIGPQRRPYLVIDAPGTLAGGQELGARSAAIQGLRPFATETVCCLRVGRTGDLEVDEDTLFDLGKRWEKTEALAYGFTYVIWQHLVRPLRARGIRLEMPHIRILHSGGWKRLQEQAVTEATFADGVAAVLGCGADRVLDFYGMVENVGVVYPDCEFRHKHVPAFADIIVRDPRTLSPVAAGEEGLVQVCSVLPTSFPGFLVLTEDMAEVIRYDGCPCGRRGICFRFVKRVPRREIRGCGNIEPSRTRASGNEAIHA